MTTQYVKPEGMRAHAVTLFNAQVEHGRQLACRRNGKLYAVEFYEGASKPVFDLNSTSTEGMYRDRTKEVQYLLRVLDALIDHGMECCEGGMYDYETPSSHDWSRLSVLSLPWIMVQRQELKATRQLALTWEQAHHILLEIPEVEFWDVWHYWLNREKARRGRRPETYWDDLRHLVG
ncbi:hypothetical protein RAB80_017358 [Fusarium oxysporum f. sp. vasinfectum]|nr:hypothetical protein RAB80_017358 [Fusarium oxysporum f. sp. vasinfectum]